MAVTDYCNYPSEAREIEKVGALINPNIEKIVALNPTYIFGVPSYKKLNQQLNKFGYKIIMEPNETIQDIIKTIETIGNTIDAKEKKQILIKGGGT